MGQIFGASDMTGMNSDYGPFRPIEGVGQADTPR